MWWCPLPLPLPLLVALDVGTPSSSVGLYRGEVDMVVWRWMEFVDWLVVIVVVLLGVSSSALDAVVSSKAHSSNHLMVSFITLLQLDMIYIN